MIATSSGRARTSRRTACPHASRSLQITGSGPVSSAASTGGQGQTAAAMITTDTPAYTRPRTGCSGSRSPRMADTMLSTCRVCGTSWTRNTRPPSQAQIAAVASVPV
jgi:hypothetical protein